MLILCVDSLALWKMRSMPSWSQKIKARNFPADICTRNFLGRVTNRDRTSCETRRKNSKLAQTTGTVDVFDPISGISGLTSRRASACPNLHEWWNQAAHVRCPVIDLAKIKPSSKIRLWIWSIISGVVTVLGRPGRSASQVEKSPRLNWATHFLTFAYNGTCYPNVSVKIANFLRYLALQKKKL